MEQQPIGSKITCGEFLGKKHFATTLTEMEWSEQLRAHEVKAETQSGKIRWFFFDTELQQWWLA